MPQNRSSRGPGRRPAATGGRSRPTAPRGGGSTRSTSRVPPSGVAPSARTTHWTSRTAILFLVMLVLAVSYASSMRAWLHQRSEANSLRSQIVEREAAIEQLQQAKQRWKDPAYIRAQARLRFGWVMPGQIGYRVIGDNGQVLETQNRLLDPSTAPTSTPQWWQSTWDSIVTAGGVSPTKPAKPDVRGPATRIDRSGNAQTTPPSR